MDDEALATVARLLDEAVLPYIVIGAHAVNAWLEPRFTADVDVTVEADVSGLERLRNVLARAGYAATAEHGGKLPSGPDFVRFTSPDGMLTLEIQTAKTAFQREAIPRGLAVGAALRVATPEDLIVFKLIANRPKDQIDLQGLVTLPDLDWSYVERWARERSVLAELERLRPRQ
jgi:hypothetical protein